MKNQTTLTDQQFSDLAKLTLERCRAQVMLTSQLIEDDDQLVAILTMIAADMITAGASAFADGDKDQRKRKRAMTVIMAGIAHNLGLGELLDRQAMG
jgi:hypothetical protein